LRAYKGGLGIGASRRRSGKQTHPGPDRSPIPAADGTTDQSADYGPGYCGSDASVVRCITRRSGARERELSATGVINLKLLKRLAASGQRLDAGSGWDRHAGRQQQWRNDSQGK
jgi:hypothetical protein